MRYLPDSRALVEMHRCRRYNQAIGGPVWMYIRGDIDVGDDGSLKIWPFLCAKKERILSPGFGCHKGDWGFRQKSGKK